MASPSVSVIIPCYNQGQFVAIAVQSVLEQTFKEYEIILVNDGSTDDTSQILAELASRHPDTIRLVEQDNQGLSMARQAGLERAQGDFVVFLDADDRLAPRMMESCLASFRRLPDASAVVGHTQLIYENDPARARIIGVGTNLHWPAILESNPFGACCSLMLRKAKVLEAGGVGLPGVRACEDWDLYIRMARRGMVFAAIPEILSSYLQHENVLSHNIEKMLDAKIGMLNRLDPAGAVGPLSQYRNGYVLFALGQGVGRQYGCESLSAILERMIPSEMAFRYFCNQFLYGLQHSVLLTRQALGPQYIAAVCQLTELYFKQHGFSQQATMFVQEIGREMKAPLKKKSLKRALSRLMDLVRRDRWIF